MNVPNNNFNDFSSDQEVNNNNFNKKIDLEGVQEYPETILQNNNNNKHN